MRDHITKRLTELAELEGQLQQAIGHLTQRVQQTQASLLRVEGARAELNLLTKQKEAEAERVSNGDATETAAGD